MKAAGRGMCGWDWECIFDTGAIVSPEKNSKIAAKNDLFDSLWFYYFLQI
jgi:hypothetical protein